MVAETPYTRSVRPTVLGERFELTQQAARGGMGSVWRARDLTTGSQVAVKVLSLDGRPDVARFEREAAMLAQLHHPNVVRYVTHGVSDGIHYLVQEWVDGITVGTQLVTIGFVPTEAIQMAIGIADALGAAHRLGIVHRDVKPGNLILDRGEVDRIKLVDFGIARLAADAGVLTRTGVLIGTPSYMSPEQARGSVVIDANADVWALGCVLYEALTGRKAFAGRTPEAVRAKVLMSQPERLDTHCPEAPSALVDLVHAMLSKRPQDRPPTGDLAAAWLRALPPIIDGKRRRGGQKEGPTVAVPPRAASGTKPPPDGPSYIFFSVMPQYDEASEAPAEEPADAAGSVKRISDRFGLESFMLEDGSVVMASPESGKAGAMTAARAAMALREECFDGAISLFAPAPGESLGDAIDRGAESLQQATLLGLFGELASADHTIRVDEVIAEMIEEEIPLHISEDATVIKSSRGRSR